LIPLLGSRALLLRRFGAPQWYEGRAIRDEGTDSLITGSLVPRARRVRVWDAEGSGAEEQVDADMVSYSEVRTASEESGAPADRIYCSNTDQWYEVYQAEGAPAFLGQRQHWKVKLVKVAPMPPDEPEIPPDPEEDP